MKLLHVLYFVIGTWVPIHAIDGGIKYDIENVPYMAQLFKVYEGFWLKYSGAIILSEYWILTAAHTLTIDEGLMSIRVRTGTNRTVSGGSLHNISEIINHDGYNMEATRWNDDIALIRLESPIVFDKTRRPIEISQSTPEAGDIITVTGYGLDHAGIDQHRGLHLGNQTVLSLEECKNRYRETGYNDYALLEKLFCTDSTEVDACGGDSGGPAVLNGKLVGVAVEGCESPLPNVYVDVVGQCDWIEEHTGLDLCK